MNQKQLMEKYTKIFRQKDLPMNQTCMCWGLSIGKGWYWLIDMLCGSIQSHIDAKRYPPREIPQLEAIQVKEKFGGLRFYYNGGDEEISGMIEMAENMSYHICESCGSTKNIKQTEGWIYTLCGDCLKKEKES